MPTLILRPAVLAVLVLLTTSEAARAQVAEPLYAREPADAAVLNPANNSAVIELLPDSTRVIPARLPRSGTLRARLIDNPSVEVAIAYESIVRFETFPRRLIRAATEHAKKREFGDAYDYFARLDRDYPNEPGFNEAFAAALKAEALHRFRQGEHDHALALLETLAERSPRMVGLSKAVDSIGDEIIKNRWDQADYAGVRRAIDTLESQFKDLRLSVGDRWIERIEQRADGERKRAEALYAKGKPRQALRAISGALSLDPDSMATNRLAERLSGNDKTLWVGVWEAAGEGVGADLNTPAARRVSRLTGGRLATLDDYQPAGGEYVSALGRLRVSDGRRRLTIPMGASERPGDAFRLARVLLDASPTASAPIGLLRRQAASIAIDQGGSLVVDLRGPHPAPSALAALSLPPEIADVGPSAWQRVALPAETEASARYERTSGSGAFDIVEEYAYATFDEAMDALRSREIHILANVPPWKLPGLKSTPGVRLRPYRLPTLHCLLVAPETPLRGRREVRRAIIYSIARDETLATLVLGGQKLPGFSVLSAPLPKGVSLSDPLRYGYNDSVDPRPYEPRLGALLLTAARAADESARNAADKAGDQPPSDPPIPESITLAHPPTPKARQAVAALRDQIEAIGLGVTLVEAGEAALAAGTVDYDLLYAEIRLGEPLVDVWRLLGPDGISGECSPPMRAGLERVLDAPTGKEAARALLDLHRIIFAELPIIPLWQTVEHFAHQRSLRGFQDSPVDLYQGIDTWKISGGGAR